MCGRFTLYAQPDFIQDEFQIENDEWISEYESSYNVAPTQKVLTVVQGKQKYRAGFMKWGLVPFWAKEASIGYKMINARSETIEEKPSYKHLVNKRHCIVLASGFYEWKKENGTKQPYYIQTNNNKLLKFAGLWDRYEKDGNSIVTCTILTKGANETMEPLHHRMPVMLNDDNWKTWLTPSEYSFDEFMKKFYKDDISLSYFPVSTKVNKPSHNEKECTERIL
ncbi:SOS response-associated peptidase [Bacillus shivajii]|uniref:SOS response-associated peptidase n=1 Tax=Bacillus shivajii TaxID=1983719 RepID=UPI001CFB11F9|nr:SOS response-associated peptidase [Bacillus shivajii]UCZ54908.1 SOS response-associated peptidase [Bacillus shivajii]